mgnify:CR=1 FL=1
MTEKKNHLKFKAMGSSCEITLIGSSNADKILAALQSEVSRLERKYSRFLSESELSAINASAGDTRGILVDEETLAIFEHASACYEQSDGLFDITAGPLNKIWDYRKAVVPDKNKNTSKCWIQTNLHKGSKSFFALRHGIRFWGHC